MIKNDKFREQAEKLVSQMTLEEKMFLLTGHQHPVERLGLGEFFIGTEVARGFVGRENDRYSTVTPQPIGLAGTFDTDLIEKLGEIAGNECRAYYNEKKKSNLCVWGPTVDMERDPRWGRTEEAYGEDVCLAGEMTASYTRGLAGYDQNYFKTIPTLKHFCANNNEKNRISCNAYLPLRLKYEYYYSAFMNAIKYGGARSVMTAYNEINGIPAMCNPELNTILKDKWGLWFAVTDGGDFAQTVVNHKYCESHAETLAEGLKAGCDNMTDYDVLVKSSAEKALAEGLIAESDIDRAVSNVVYARLKLGQLAGDCPYDSITKDIVDNEESRKINLRASREQVVLLKNNGILPLRKKYGKIAVVGALANQNLRDWYTGVFRDAVSVSEGIGKEFPESEIVYDNLWDIVAVKASNGKYLSVHEDGTVHADTVEITDSEFFELQNWGENWNNLFSVKYGKYLSFADDTLKLNNSTIYDWFTRETFNILRVQGGFLFEEYLGHSRLNADTNGNIVFSSARAVTELNTFQIQYISSKYERAEKIAEQSDIVVFCTGNHPVQVAKECHDRTTLALNVQAGMAEHLYNCNKNTVMVLVSSYPYAINHENDTLPAIIYTTHAGANLGTAVSETLSGKNNPSGRLAMTWYRSENDLPDIMDYDIEKTGMTYMYFKGTPLYPFGYGLSYSDFEYCELSVICNDGIKADVTVKNVSDTDGDEVIQLYYTVENSAVSRPLKKLCAFARVHLMAGEEKTVTLSVPEHILQIYDTHSGEMLTETGIYRFMTGKNSAELSLTAEIEIKGQEIPVRNTSFSADSFDSGENVKICWAKNIKRHYVRTFGWSGTLVYKDVPFGKGKSLIVSVSSVMGETTLNISADSNKYELKVYPSVSFDDFKEYSIELPENISDMGELVLNTGEGAGILEVKIK